MKVIDLWKAGERPTVSFELFPARSEKGADSLDKAIDKLADLNPQFVSVTFGAGGSTRDGSRQLVNKLKNEKNLEVVAYFAGFGLGPEDIVSVLNDYQALGIENFLIVRGDPPREGDFTPHADSFQYSCDILEFVRPKYEACMGVAGYPEAHIDALSPERDLEILKLKIDCGAEYIISNYFYDNAYFFDFQKRCRAAGIEVPIIPGIMPIYSIKMMEMLAGLCGATITDELRQGIDALPQDDKEALSAFGIDFAARQCAELLKAGVPGLHIYTMDRSKASVAVVEALRGDGLL